MASCAQLSYPAGRYFIDDVARSIFGLCYTLSRPLKSSYDAPSQADLTGFYVNCLIPGFVVLKHGISLFFCELPETFIDTQNNPGRSRD
ncbi:hypothetical protein ES703_38706 [subsurface metagenome]